MRELPRAAHRLRIYCGEDDRHGRMPLHEALVRAAFDAGLSGATVLRGSMGYGAHHHIHTARVLRLAEELPVIVEIVDAREAIEAFMPTVRALTPRGLVTLESVEILLQPSDPEA